MALWLGRDASLMVCDRGYLRHQKAWRRGLANAANRSVLQVEGDVVAPVEAVSDKSGACGPNGTAAAPQSAGDFLKGLAETATATPARGLRLDGDDVDLSDVPRLLERLDVDTSVPPVRRLEGGTCEARRRLTRFLRRGLDGYADRNEPAEWHSSLLSPYLHFGQISPVEVALKVRDATQGRDNCVHHQANYDSYSCLPDWARQTLAEHQSEERAHIYTRSEKEAADTHDRYWNAAMRELFHTGFIPSYLWRCWGKKILEWCRTPEHAYPTALQLNNKYFLDGGDANAYANVAWCFGLHDREWTERPVFGRFAT